MGEVRKKALRADIRTLLDRVEEAHHHGKEVVLTPEECGEVAWLIRRIQDEAAVDLGYEPPTVQLRVAREG